MKKREWAKLAESATDKWFTDIEAQVIDLHYHRGWAIEDVAAELYVSRSTINRLLKEIRHKLIQI